MFGNLKLVLEVSGRLVTNLSFFFAAGRFESALPVSEILRGTGDFLSPQIREGGRAEIFGGFIFPFEFLF